MTNFSFVYYYSEEQSENYNERIHIFSIRIYKI